MMLISVVTLVDII